MAKIGIITLNTTDGHELDFTLYLNSNFNYNMFSGEGQVSRFETSGIGDWQSIVNAINSVLNDNLLWSTIIWRYGNIANQQYLENLSLFTKVFPNSRKLDFGYSSDTYVKFNETDELSWRYYDAANTAGLYCEPSKKSAIGFFSGSISGFGGTNWRSGFNLIIYDESLLNGEKFEIPSGTIRYINLVGQMFSDHLELTYRFEQVDSNSLSFFDGKDFNAIGGDPFEPGGTTGEGGGGGSFDNTSTPIEIPNLPTISAASTGFISLFNPSLPQLKELASYLWSNLFEIDGWKKLFADPMDAILGLSILPVSIPSGGVREVKVGNIGTGISLTVAASQFVEVDCGSINVNEYWGAYLDYEPYSQAQIFLPYIGTRPISVDEIMGKTVRVVYHVDILTGACCCFVKCGESVLYTYNGQCSIPIPITGANYTSVVNGVISVAASVGSLVATGGASAPTAVPAIASSVVNQMKPQIEKSGSISGPAGVLNMQTPYLILIRPRQALPSKQNEFIGYPSLITVQLTELTGYTEVQSIHLESIPATQEELAEIQSLLEGGVIF